MNVGEVFDERSRNIEVLQQVLRCLSEGLDEAACPDWDHGGARALELREAVSDLAAPTSIHLLTPSLMKALTKCGPFVRAGEIDQAQLDALRAGARECQTELRDRLEGLALARIQAEAAETATASLRLLNLVRTKIGPIRVGNDQRTFEYVTIVEDAEDPTCEPPSACLVAGEALLDGVPERTSHAVVFVPKTAARADAANFHGCWAWYARVLLNSLDDAGSERERVRWALAGSLLTATVLEENPKTTRAFGLREVCEHVIEYGDLPDEIAEFVRLVATPFPTIELPVLSEKALGLLKRVDTVAAVSEKRGRKAGRPKSSAAGRRKLARLVEASTQARSIADWTRHAVALERPMMPGSVDSALNWAVRSTEYRIVKCKVERLSYFGTPEAIARLKAKEKGGPVPPN